MTREISVALYALIYLPADHFHKKINLCKKSKIDSREQYTPRSYTLMRVRASQKARPSLVPLITNWPGPFCVPPVFP